MNVHVANEKIFDFFEDVSKDEGTDNLCCALGLNKDSNDRSYENQTNILTRYFQGRNFSSLYGKEHRFPDMKLTRTERNLDRTGEVFTDDLRFISEDEEAIFEEMTTVRTDFRETMLFWDFELGADGRKGFPDSLPHSITTWVFQAVSVSPSHGICVSEPQWIVSKKKIFLQLNLPYSVVRNEQVKIQATLFNYGFNKIRVSSMCFLQENCKHVTATFKPYFVNLNAKEIF
ncbi:complement C3 [Trichonephila clavipes]|nr:complement C3 [Trichonephila clavipes]